MRALKDNLKAKAKKLFRSESSVQDGEGTIVLAEGGSPSVPSPREHNVSPPPPPSQPLDATAQINAYHYEVSKNVSRLVLHTIVDNQDNTPSTSQVEPAFDNSQRSNTETSPLPDQVVAKAELWQQAFDELSEKQKQSLLMLAGDDKPTNDPGPDHSAVSIIPDLIDRTRARQEECEKRAWRIGFGEDPARKIILRDQTVLIISWLTKAGDIGVQFAPTVVTQVWPCVKAVLKIPVEEANQMAALLTVVDKIAQATARGRVYEMSFTSSNTSTEVLGSLHNGLVALYKACFELLENVADLLKENWFRRTVHSLLNPAALKDKIAGFSSLEEQLAKSVQAASAAISGELLQRVRNLDEPVARVDKSVLDILELVTASEEQEILEWISLVPYHGHHEDVVQKRMKDTCDWLLRHLKFRTWEASGESVLLWLQGNPGTGKTFLTSKVIDRKLGLLGSGSHDEAFAFFYFSRGDSSRNTALSCLQSLVRQLSTSYNRSGHMQPALKKVVQECRRHGRVLSRDTCQKQLAESINLFPRVTIILDALDECQEDEDDSEGLVKILDGLMKSSSRPLLVFISSRPGRDIKNACQDRPNVNVGEEDNQEDISKFVRDKIMNANNNWKRIPMETRETVVSTLLKKSKGMFRWSALQVYELLKLPLLDQVLDRLGKLPEGLKETYDDIYSKQSHDPSGIASKIIDRAIMWVMVAREPLNSFQLLTAVRIDPVKYVNTMVNVSSRSLMNRCAHKESRDAGYIVQGGIDEELVLGYCANLLTVSSETGKWAFAHASVAEYFEEHHFGQLQAHAFVGSVGLVTLLDFSRSIVTRQPLGAMGSLTSYSAFDSLSFFKNYDELRKNTPHCATHASHPFLQYVVCRWAEHMGLYDESLSNQGDEARSPRPVTMRDSGLSLGDHSALLESFIGHPNDSNIAFQLYLDQSKSQAHESRLPRDFSMFFPKRVTQDLFLFSNERLATFTIVGYGLFNLLHNWWQPETSPNRGEVIGSELTAPSRPLIDTAVRSQGGWSLLHIACGFDRVPVVEALLEAGMDPSERNKGWNALSVASRYGHIDICRILIKKAGCSPDPLSGTDYSALCLAVDRGHVDVVRYLLSQGADPNQSYRSGVSVLARAAAGNFANVLRSLIENGRADPNMLLPAKSYCGTAAIWAAYLHRYECLEYLIRQAHVNVNAHIPTGKYRTVAIALIAGLDRRWRPRCSRSEVNRMISVFKGLGVDFANIQKLSQSWVYSSLDPSTEDFVVTDNWVLRMAICYGDVAPVQFLVDESGLDFNQLLAQAGERESLLSTAVIVGDNDTMEFLINRGSDVTLPLKTWDARQSGSDNLNGETYSNALALALTCTHIYHYILTKPLEFLLDHGVDINIAWLDWIHRGFRGWNANSLTWLHKNGVDVDLPIEHGQYGSALARAVSVGWESGVRWLLKIGANVNLVLQYGRFGSALMAAVGCSKLSKYRRADIVKSLLDHGADVNLQTPEDHDTLTEPGYRRARSALMVAAEAGDEDLAYLLVGRGADVNRPENQGWQKTMKSVMEEPRVWLAPDLA